MALLPVGIPFTAWANQLRNEYPTQDIPIVRNENDWRQFPNMLKENRAFEGTNFPFSTGFARWQDWAAQFILSIGA